MHLNVFAKQPERSETRLAWRSPTAAQRARSSPVSTRSATGPPGHSFERINVFPPPAAVQPIQRKPVSIGEGDQILWYDDENTSLGFFPTRPALLQAMSQQPVDLFDVTGKNIRQVEAVLQGPIYRKKAFAGAQYRMQYSVFDPNGRCRLEVYAPDTNERVGYAEYTVQSFAPQKPPKPTEPYTKEHILAREGKVVHLTGFYNETLTRQGPADIYSGFATEMLRSIEADARGLKAGLIYLEAASAQVRIDPNTNERRPQASISFYEKFGYGQDATAAAHNWQIATKQSQDLGLSEEDALTLIKNELRGRTSAILVKQLR